jgi:hypothetical protein
MAWPTTTVNTTHLDEGSDNPANARGDILQMANNVNDMNNMITMTGVSNNDILQYSSAQGKFIPIAQGTFLSNAVNIAVVSFGASGGAGVSVSGTLQYFVNISETADPSGFISVDESTDALSIGAGTYLLQSVRTEITTSALGDLGITAANPPGVTGDFFAGAASQTTGTLGGQTFTLKPQIYAVVTLASAQDWRFYSTTVSGLNHTPITITKIG